MVAARLSKLALALPLAALAACQGTSLTNAIASPVTYDTQQRKEGFAKELGYFTYQEGPDAWYVDYQGTDANSRDELAGWVRRRAEELCHPKVAEVVIEQSDWIGSRVYWQMSNWPLGAMPRGGAGTFPKVMGRVTCVASP